MVNKITDDYQLTSIEIRANAASSGPWKAMLEGRDHSSGSSCIVTPTGSIDLEGASDSDIEFMAHARQDIPYLISEVRRLMGILSSK
ncbi:MAG: hypothetical protein Q7U57_01835 [Methylovulum sp.]|nr:hypothetical protein [Methylovulum sp.]